jgi:hypothetical protein
MGIMYINAGQQTNFRTNQIVHRNASTSYLTNKTTTFETNNIVERYYVDSTSTTTLKASVTVQAYPEVSPVIPADYIIDAGIVSLKSSRINRLQAPTTMLWNEASSQRQEFGFNVPGKYTYIDQYSDPINSTIISTTMNFRPTTDNNMSKTNYVGDMQIACSTLTLSANTIITIKQPITINYTYLNQSTYFTTIGGLRNVGYYYGSGDGTGTSGTFTTATNGNSTTGNFFVHGSISDMPIGIYSASLKLNIYCVTAGSFRLYLEGPGDFSTPTYNAATAENTVVNVLHTFYLSAISTVKQRIRVTVISGSFFHNSYGYDCFYIRIS